MHVSSLGFRTDLALLTASGSVVEDRGTHLVGRTPDNPIVSGFACGREGVWGADAGRAAVVEPVERRSCGGL